MSNYLDDTFLIMNTHSFWYEPFKKNGYKVTYPYKGKNRLLLRILRELHFRLNLPKKNLWFRDISCNTKYIFLLEALIIPEYLIWLHNKRPDAKMVMFYMNNCLPSSNPDFFRFDFIKLWSGDINDCKQYNINLSPNVGAYFKSWTIPEGLSIDYDIFFVGRDKGFRRLKPLLQLEKEFNKIGIKTYFHIVPEHIYDRFRNSRYQRLLSYEDVLTFIGRSKAILYLTYGSQECVTLRIQEALVHKKKLIIDCTWIKKYDFYDPRNIFILGENNIDKLQDFLNSPYVEVKADILTHIYIEDLIEGVIKESWL